MKLSRSICSALVLPALFLSPPPADAAVPVTAQTEPMLLTGNPSDNADRADDVCVWVDPRDPSHSVLIGVNKSDNGIDGGLYAFDFDGNRALNVGSWIEGVNLFEKGERYNNVDIRYGVQAGTRKWDLVCASNRSDREIDVFRVKRNAAGSFAGLELVGEVELGSGFAGGTAAPYGLGMFQPRSTDRTYVLTSDKEGKVAQYRLLFDASGSGQDRIRGTRVGQVFDVSRNGSEVEGIVGDDEKGVIYIAAEDRGIYRYNTDDQGVLRTGGRVTVATPRSDAELTADVEGLTLYHTRDGGGYLIASSQGNSTYAVYDRSFQGTSKNAFIKSFSISGVQNTDGLDVCSANLGGDFTSGALIVHDGKGDRPTRYKLVKWEDVAEEGSTDLEIDTRWDPRP